jgi:NAD(P)-dependent dehydrogenase (short-subunit alcohol dehydrogenase family)
MSADLAGRVAIVTGAGRGLGRAMAEGLASAGCRVVATAAREPAELEPLVAAFPDHVIALRADVTDATDCTRSVETALARFGRLDILVNNAGRGMRTISSRFMVEPTKFWQADIAAWRVLIDTNVNGPFLMARAAVPVMLKAGWGRIINISMNHETMRRAGFSPYGPSKAALESETVIWAQDLAGTGVTVNALLPGGATRTGMIPSGIPDHIGVSLLDPKIMVPPLLYLASDRSDGVTGRRFTATLWPGVEPAGWPPPTP